MGKYEALAEIKYPWENPKFRTYLYGVAVAIFAVLVMYDIVNADQAPTWLQLIESLLGLGATGTALAYRPTRPDIRDDGLPLN